MSHLFSDTNDTSDRDQSGSKSSFE